MRITNQQRQQAKYLRLQSLRIGRTYAPKLASARRKEMERVLSLADRYSPEDWPVILPKKLNEKYLKSWYSQMFIGVGMPVARTTVNNFLSRKSDTDMWHEALNGWISKNAGRKVKIISKGFKDWFTGALKEAIKDQTMGIEQLTQELSGNIMNVYEGVQEWEIRRIVQTESLTALSVAQDESIKALGIPYTKTWVISGNNTRPAHAEMDGVTIDEDEAFIVDGEEMMYPRDDSMGASAGNIVNCACTVFMSPK